MLYIPPRETYEYFTRISQKALNKKASKKKTKDFNLLPLRHSK